MDCKDIEREGLLAGLADGSLTEDERVAVLSHLGACGRCRGELEEVKKLILEIRAIPADASCGEPAGAFPYRVKGLVAPIRPAGRAGGLIFRISMPAVAALVAIFFAYALVEKQGFFGWRAAGSKTVESSLSGLGQADRRILMRTYSANNGRKTAYYSLLELKEDEFEGVFRRLELIGGGAAVDDKNAVSNSEKEA